MKNNATIPLLLAGSITTAAVAACVIPDYCIKTPAPGHSVCVEFPDAEAETQGQIPIDPLLDGFDYILGCICTSEESAEYMTDPNTDTQEAEYQAMLGEMALAARARCNEIVEEFNLINDNCYTGDVDGDVIDQGETNGCEDGCMYINPPPGDSCPDECDWWREKEAPWGTDENDTGGNFGAWGDLDLGSLITYSRSTGYTIDAEVIATANSDQLGFLESITVPTQLYDGAGAPDGFEISVSSGDFFDHLGLEDGDVLEKINNDTIVDMDDLIDANDDLLTTSNFTLTVARGSGSTTLHYEID